MILQNRLIITMSIPNSCNLDRELDFHSFAKESVHFIALSDRGMSLRTVYISFYFKLIFFVLFFLI